MSWTTTLEPVSPGATGSTPIRSRAWFALTALAAAVGLGLLLTTVTASSATYDEVTYLRIAAGWWRGGGQEEISRMGSPLLFWKLQQVPVLWAVDRLGRGDWIDDPVRHQAALLPWIRLGCAWIWLAALVMTAAWSRRLHGLPAMTLAAWLFALSPNLIAHAGLATMEFPLLAAGLATVALFGRFLTTGRARWFVASAVAAGLAFSCKFTAILFPPILGLAWAAQARRGSDGGRASRRALGHVLLGTATYVAVMLAVDVAATGFARMPLSGSSGEHPSVPTWLGPRFSGLISDLYELPIPQDWAALAHQLRHQASGGPSYLLGERRMTGWRHYYFVALAVKVPLAFWALVVGRLLLVRRRPDDPLRAEALLPPTFIAAFLVATALGSSRNYGVRYILPLAPLAIVWVSGLAAGAATLATSTPPWPRLLLIGVGLAGQAAAVASVHPHELTYFNALAGGPLGGRRILSDSNLDWGQGLRALAGLQVREPGFRDLTIYYFGDTDPGRYGVAGVAYVVDASDEHPGLPPPHAATTEYVAVSASLQWGPWGPAGFFRELDGLKPCRFTDDTTIAIYRTADLGRRPPSIQ